MGELYSSTQPLPYIASKKLITVSPCKESLKGLGVCFVFSSIDWKHALSIFSRVSKIIPWIFALCTCKKDTSKRSLIYFLLLKKGLFIFSALIPLCQTWSIFLSSAMATEWSSLHNVCFEEELKNTGCCTCSCSFNSILLWWWEMEQGCLIQKQSKHKLQAVSSLKHQNMPKGEISLLPLPVDGEAGVDGVEMRTKWTESQSLHLGERMTKEPELISVFGCSPC